MTTLRWTATAVATTALSVAISACGGSAPTAHSPTTTSTRGGGTTVALAAAPTGPASLRGDEDGSDGRHYHDSDDRRTVEFGRAAKVADRQAIEMLVAQYHSAALVDDGVRACALLYSLMAESVPEDWGQQAGPAYARGSTCPVVMSKIFAHSRSQIAGEWKVTGVRVRGRKAIALLGGSNMPASSIALQREQHRWTIVALIDTPLS